MTANWRVGTRWQWTTKPSYLYVQDIWQQPLVMIPPNHWENTIKYDLLRNGETRGHWRDAFVSVEKLLIDQQRRVPANRDLGPPPPIYSLWNIGVGGLWTISDKLGIDVNLSATNLFDVQYRDCMNRFWYYTNDLGRNMSLRMKWNFQIGQSTEYYRARLAVLCRKWGYRGFGCSV